MGKSGGSRSSSGSPSHGKHSRRFEAGDSSGEDQPRRSETEYKRAKLDDDGGAVRKEGNENEVYVGSLSWEASERDLEDLFADCGRVLNVKLLMNPDGRSRGAAFIQFDGADAVEKALQLDGSEHMNRRIRVNKSGDRPQRKPTGDPNTVFVGNLAYSTTEEDIQDFFRDCGEVKSVRLAKDQDGRAKGFAHVEFEDATGVDKALKQNGEDLNGRSVKVDYAVRKDSGFRGRGMGPRRSFGDRPRRGGFQYEGSRY